MRIIAGVILLACGLPGTLTQAQNNTVLPDFNRVEIGRRIYEEGILPYNIPLRGHRATGLTLVGPSAACVTCHRRSGMGSIEGSLEKTVLVPPVMGQILFSPARYAGNFIDPSHHYIPNEAWSRALSRQAYTSASFARALREGIDPSGKPLAAPMLQYDFDDAAITGLIAYLQQLSATPSPGVTAGILHIATIVTDEVSTAERDAVLAVLTKWSATSHTAGKSLQLHVWMLEGTPDSWIGQLAHYYQQQPVFAVLSGIGAATWLPVHQFCESQQLPCVLPALEVAPEDNMAYYSVYFSPGVTLEARLLAHHLETTSIANDNIIQIYADATGSQAAKALRQAIHLAFDTATDRRLRVTAPTAALRGIPDSAQLILWLRPAQIAQLIDIWPQRPPVQRIYLSALLTPPGSVVLPPEWQSRTAYVTLFDDIGVQGELAKIRLKNWLDGHNQLHSDNLRLQSDAYAACYFFSEALAEIRAQEVRRPAVPLNRELLLETLETLVTKYDDGATLINPDSHIAFYGRMSLGPAQRIAVRGGGIFHYDSKNSNRLVAASGRIVP